MKIVGRIVKWGALTVLALLVLGIAVLLVIGVPKPPAITAENVNRLPLGYVTDNLEAIRTRLDSKSFSDWLPGMGMLVWSSRNLVDMRLHHISGAGAEPTFLSELDRRAAVYTGREPDEVIARWDVDGTEAYQLYRWTPGDEPVRLTDGEERATFGAFEPSGGRIAYTSTRRNGEDNDIYVADPAQPGSEERVLEVDGLWGVLDWSPVADEILVVRLESNSENELYVLDLETRDLRLVSDTTADPVLHRSVRWSADGGGLYYVSDRDAEFRRLRRLDLETATETVLVDLPWDVESVQESAAGDFLILRVNEDGRSSFHRYETASGELAPLDFGLEGHVRSAVLHPERSVLALTHVDPTGRSRVYVHDLETGTTELRAGELPTDADFEPAQIVRYPTFDTVEGAPRLIPAIVYPGLGDGPRPVFIQIHGGPEGQSVVTPGAHLPLQRKGITVIEPNVRGSTGYGKTYQSLDDGYRRENSVRDIGALLDWIETRPELDASRVVVAGGSYGGYMSLASLVHYGDRLRCGIDIVGISNFVTFLENTADYRRDIRRAEYGDERDPEMRAFLESISPANHAGAIDTPLMIVQGANDPRVPVTEAEQMVERVREDGTPVSYIVAANEGHGFRNPWNNIYQSVAMLDFADDCFEIDGPRI